MHLALIDTFEVELDGIFSGGDVGADLVEFAERGIQCGGFTGTGWSGNQTHSEGQVDGVLKYFQRSGIETKFGHVELEVALVEQTHNDFFAEKRWQNAYTKVHL